MASLDGLLTEQRNPRSLDIDTKSSLEIVRVINEEDKGVALAVEKELGNIAAAVDLAVAAVQGGGRLFYVGCGTSGRLGVLDASECPVTFGVSPDLVVGIISGGFDALLKSKEEIEDDPGAAAADLRAHHLTAKDAVVGIAASGRTPYVVGALSFARETGSGTISICCNPGTPMSQLGDVRIVAATGPEVVTGSTRMKAGTAQKMVLNMISTAAMIKLGKCYQNLMIDLRPSCGKLRERTKRILSEVTGCDMATSGRVLEESGFNLKQAILIQLTGMDQVKAQALLDANDGHVWNALKSAQQAFIAKTLPQS